MIRKEMQENLKQALGMIRGGRKDVAEQCGIRPVNLDRNLDGEVKNNHQVIMTTKRYIEEKIKELQKLIEQAAEGTELRTAD